MEGKKKEIEGRLPNGDADGEWQQVRELLEEGSQAIKNQDVARANKLMKKAEILTGLMRAPAEILTGTQRLHLQAILNQKPLTDEALGKADRLLEMFLHDQLIEQYRSQITNNSIRISNSSPRMNQVIFIEYTDWNLGGINQYLEYEWTFDDSLSEGGCKVPHFFAKEGNYGLQVRVRKELDGSVLGEAQIDRKSREAIKVRRSEREWYWWQRLTLLEGLINMGVILVAAIAAVKLFYTDTFGTFNDYISAFVWVFGINASTNFTFGDLIRARYPNTFAPPGQ
ncbi:MAG: hypothetical protein HYS70_04015 [Nitrospinae bacterium]|nr:hypothetical protein [Nitrospinota bacterium]